MFRGRNRSLYDLARQLQCAGQTCESRFALLDCKVSLTEGVDTTCGFGSEAVSESESKRLGADPELLHACINQSS